MKSGIERKTKNHHRYWVIVTISEMTIFIGILFLMGIMGIMQMPDITLYRSKNKMYGNARIKTIMKRDRFLTIVKYFYFFDNSTCM